MLAPLPRKPLGWFARLIKSMRNTLLALIASICFLAGVAVILVPTWHGQPLTLQLPGGIEVAVRGSGFGGRLVFTRWRAETAEWWKMAGHRSMNVSAQTVVLSGNGGIIYAAQLYVDFGTKDWHGIEFGGGAISKTPVTKAGGVMSTALVPFSWVGVPWYYPLPLFWGTPAIWLTLAIRRGRIKAGLCPRCHYDLRASPDRCPECGLAIETTKTFV